MFLTEGQTCRLPHTVVQIEEGTPMEGGSDVYCKIRDIGEGAWWTGSEWGVETELSASESEAQKGGWYYDLEVEVGLAGHRIEWWFYSKNTVTYPLYDSGRVAPADSVYELGLGVYATTFHCVDSGGSDVPYAYVVVYAENSSTKVGAGYTDNDGEVELQLDAGDYDVRVGPIIVEGGGLSYSPDETPYSVSVSATATETLSLTKNELETDGLTFGNMKSQVARILLDVFDERFDNNLIEKWIRSAHIKTDTEIKWTRDRLTLTTEAGESDYNTIASRRNIIRLTDSLKNPLEYIEFDEYIERDSSSGTPREWTVWGGQVILYPTPTAAEDLTLWVVRLPGPMVCDGDIPSLPAELHQSIVDYALHRAYIHLEDMIAAEVYYKKWAEATVVFGKDASDYRGKKERIRDVEGF